ncbi:MAG: hypothetical protein KIT36_24300, partial [Alphaproteobacteria bacterium]|nr:hypothetical protein [Alphaproteobacteria bacterium]
MSMELDRGQRREPLLAYAVVGIAVLYAAFTLGLEVLSWRLNIEFDIPAWRTDSPVEICLALIVIGGLIFAVTQVYRHRRDAALRLGWSYATVAMALIATSEMADWFNETAPFWSEDFWFETPLWLIAAWCLHQCIRLYAARPRYWFRAGFALQVASAVLDLLKNEIGRLPLVSPEALEVAVEYSALLCVLCYVLSLALTRVGPRTAGWSDRLTGGARLAVAALGVQAPRATQPVAVGALARRLYVDRHMFRAARYPTRYPVLHRAGLRQAVNVAMAAFFGSRIGPRIEQAAGRSLAGQFVDLLRMAVGQGIDAVSYYLFELYRPGGRGEAPYYLTRYETKNGLLTVLNAARARLTDVPHDLTDKAAFGEACRQAGIPTPPILLSAVDGKIDRHVPVTDFDRDLFAKLKRGRGTMQTG